MDWTGLRCHSPVNRARWTASSRVSSWNPEPSEPCVFTSATLNALCDTSSCISDSHPSPGEEFPKKEQMWVLTLVPVTSQCAWAGMRPLLRDRPRRLRRDTWEWWGWKGGGGGSPQTVLAAKSRSSVPELANKGRVRHSKGRHFFLFF